MRTLFAKILIWFWLAFAVMIVAFALLESVARQRRLQLPMGRGGPLGMVTPLAEDALQREGRAGLIRIVNEMESDAPPPPPHGPPPGGPSQRRGGPAPGPVRVFEFRVDPGPRHERVYVLDSTGAEVRGTPVPPPVAALARATLESPGGRVIEERQGQMRMGSRVESPAAGRYVLVVQRPAPSRFPPILPRDLWLKLGVMLAIGAIGCYLLARHITAPIERLRRATQRLAGGDLTARVGVQRNGGGDELKELGQDFDRMAERLETAASMQRRLLRDVSHELRSPLARMQVGIGILRQVASDEKSRATIERLDSEAGRLASMIQDLLTISRLESREWTIAREPVDVSALVDDVAADAAFEAGTRGSTVQVGHVDPVVVDGVRDLLRSAIDNVVRNAVRHTREGTAVEIAVRACPDGDAPHATVTVRDHGDGVPKDQLTRIFEPFYRVDDVRARSTGGAGLGLSIARRCLEEHGGSIAARRAEGGGLEVVLRLPLSATVHGSTPSLHTP